MRQRLPLRMPILVVSFVLVVGLIAAYRWLVFPWLAPPPESPERIAALWTQVERTATPQADERAPAELPQVELHWAASMRERLTPKDGVAVSLTDEQIDAPARAALAGLLAWSVSVPSQPIAVCTPTPGRATSVPLLILGRLALARASFTGDDAHLVAALRLGRTLRRREQILGFLVGIALASEAAAWAADHQVAMRGALAELAPTHQELLAALAREHVCTERMLREAGPPLRGWQGLLVRQDREQQMLRWYWGSMFDRALANQHDINGLATVYRIDDPAQLPKSFLCRAIAMDAERRLLESERKIHEYVQVVSAAR